MMSFQTTEPSDHNQYNSMTFNGMEGIVKVKNENISEQYREMVCGLLAEENVMETSAPTRDLLDLDAQNTVNFNQNNQQYTVNSNPMSWPYYNNTYAQDVNETYGSSGDYSMNMPIKQEFPTQTINNAAYQMDTVQYQQFQSESTNDYQPCPTEMPISILQENVQYDTSNSIQVGSLYKSNESTKPKLYNCSVCNKFYNSRGHLTRHFKTKLHQNCVESAANPDLRKNKKRRRQTKLQLTDSMESYPKSSDGGSSKNTSPLSFEGAHNELQQNSFQPNSMPSQILHSTQTFQEPAVIPNTFYQPYQPYQLPSHNEYNRFEYSQNMLPNQLQQDENNPFDFQSYPNYIHNNFHHQVKQEPLQSFNPFPYSTQNSIIHSFSEEQNRTHPMDMQPMTTVHYNPIQSDAYPVEALSQICNVTSPEQITSTTPSLSPSDVQSNTTSGTSSGSLTPPEPSKNCPTEEVQHKCIECNKLFKRVCYLTQHNKTFHNGEKPFTCQRCGKRFSTVDTLEEHIGKHMGEKPFKCLKCPKQFHHKTDLRRHMYLHEGQKPHACEVCTKAFVRKDHLMHHMETHRRRAQKLESKPSK